ncbi:MAG: hypothetical protein ACRD16_17560 [Thermoanaerobaculia bacterium]
MTRSPRLSISVALLGALASLSLGVVSIQVFVRDLALRRRAESFFSRFTLDVRRPLDRESIPLAPSGDWTAGIAASSALSDAAEGISLAKMSPGMRRLWLDSATKVGDELKASEDLIRAAIASRPGWPYYRFLLGELIYVRENREQNRDLALHPDKWAVPLRTAASGAPGDDSIWRFLGGAYVETWQVIPDSARPGALSVLRRGFLDPDFVSSALPPAVLLLGRERALDLVPAQTSSLKAAFLFCAGRGDVESAFRVGRLLESAERAGRQEDLAKIDERYRRRDYNGLRAACVAWTSSHSIFEFDDPAGRRDLARVLERWPEDAPGSWSEDPRGALIRYFLDGRERDAPPEGLEKAVSALAGVPDYVRARVRLLSGDESGAEQIARQAPTAGSFEWTRYFLDLARARLRRGDPAAAREALSRLSPGALGECGALIVRRDVARAAGDAGEVASIERELTAATGLPRPPDPGSAGRMISPAEWTSQGSLSLCLDPSRTNGRVLSIDLRVSENASQSPNPEAVPPSLALVSYGWNDGREGSILVAGGTKLNVPLDGMEGRRNFWLRSELGQHVEPAGSIAAR